jgi:predicted kinase
VLMLPKAKMACRSWDGSRALAAAPEVTLRRVAAAGYTRMRTPGTRVPRIKGYHVRAMDAELVIFVGLQASGKSTFFRERFAATHEHVSKDLFPNNRNRNRRQTRLIEAALGSGRPVVVDNTNPTTEDRASLIAIGREFGAEIVGYSFESGVRECLARNARREGKSRVPDVAIYATAKRLVPPSRAEGFDELHCVRLRGPAFEVGPC